METISPDKTGYIHADNFEIYWEYFGKGDKEVLCLLNGIAMFTKSWYQTVASLMKDFDVILYDYPGQGASTSDDVEYNMSRFCDYLAMIMDENNVKKLHLTGISYGGFVAFEFARKYPERLHTLTISGAIITYEKLYDVNRLNSYLLLDKAPFEIFPPLLYERIFGEQFYLKVEPLLESMQQKLYERYKDRVHCIKRLIETQGEYLDNVKNKPEMYKKIAIPTLVMYGEEDTLIPPWTQERIKEVIQNCKTVKIIGSGHVVYLEKPEIFFGNMINFMKAKSLDFKQV